MQTDFKHPFAVDVRYKSGAYVTNTVNGQRASCTMSAEAAVMRLAEKLLGEAYQELLRGNATGELGLQRWYVVPDPILSAWADRDGAIVIGTEPPPAVLLQVACGPARALRYALGMEDEAADAHVPGMALGCDPAARLTALNEWVNTGARLNGRPQAHGVVFNLHVPACAA